ncbi:MAG: glycosyltransferase family 39 protein [Chloroflexi bacterium]|nr:glycosyltransferase family 39 protein [Chloroflexota bacterium]
MTHPFLRRDWFIAALAAVIAAVVIVYMLVPRPTYLDSYYHYNAAARLAQGDGLTDMALWTHLGLPPELVLPATVTPSHLYWMPMSALLSGVSMAVFGVSMDAAQIPMAVCFAGALLVAVLAGGWVTQTRRGTWLALALAILSGGFVDVWGEIDTFAPYALFGGLALAAMIAARERGRVWLWAAAGVLGGLGHLTRSDGLLLPIVGVLAALSAPRGRYVSAAAVAVGYLLTMAPWFVRMLDVVGAPLPLGGLQTAYMTDYAQIFTYPWRTLSLGDVGIGPLLQSRVEPLLINFGVFAVAQGNLLLWPFMLWGLFRANRHLLITVGLFALGLHAAMTFVFAWPGARGGLFHGAAALIPWWAALTAYSVDALARRLSRRRPRRRTLNWVAVTAIILLIAGFMTALSVRRASSDAPPYIEAIRPYVMPGDRVASVDPPEVAYWLGAGGVVLPYAAPDVLAQLAEDFDLDLLIVTGVEVGSDGPTSSALPEPLRPMLAALPPSLTLEADLGATHVYRFVR